MSEQSFDINIVRLSSSWKYINPKYISQLEDMKKIHGEFIPGNYPVIWKTRSKFVLLLTLSDGTKLAYKAPLKMRSPIRYMFRPGPHGKEAVNFQKLANIGLPLVNLAAAGEERNFFILKHSFLATEYADGFSDGRDFAFDGKLHKNTLLRDEFIRRNFQYLAKMHRAGFIHDGFTPANLLYKICISPDADGNMLDLKWIDIASCSKPFLNMNFKIKAVKDLSLFLHYFKFSNEEQISYLEKYCSSNPDIAATANKLLDLILKNPVRIS